MLVTACISLICNLVNLWALGHCCGQHGESVLDDVNSVFKPHGGHSCSHGHGAHDHKHGTCSGHDHSHNKTKKPHKDHSHNHDHNE